MPLRLFPRTPPSQAVAVSPGSCRGRVLWRPHTPHLVLAMSSHVHPYPHGSPANVATLQHQSTARILVPSGPFGLAEQGLLFQHFFLFQNCRTGCERLENLLDFDDHSAAIICADTIKYFSHPIQLPLATTTIIVVYSCLGRVVVEDN